MVGIGLALLAAISWAVSNMVVRQAFQYTNVATGTFFSLVAGSLVLWTLAVAFSLGDLGDITLRTIVWFAGIGLINFTMGRFFGYQGIRHLGVARAAPVMGSSPLFAAVFAVLFIGEQLGVLIVLGMGLVLVGLYVVIREGTRA